MKKNQNSGDYYHAHIRFFLQRFKHKKSVSDLEISMAIMSPLMGFFALGEFSRIHADVSFGGNGLGIDALWNPIYDDIPDTDLQWYAGFGPALYLGDNFRFGAAGEVGAEYAFSDVPITIGLDFRPYLFLVEETEFRAGFGLNVRWRLN